MSNQLTPKFYCPKCRTLKKTRRGMCVTCGALVGCSAIKHNEAAPFYGCGDNAVLLEEIQKLTRERESLIASLYRIAHWEPKFGLPHDQLVQEAIRDVKQIAKNILKEHDAEDTPQPR